MYKLGVIRDREASYPGDQTRFVELSSAIDPTGGDRGLGLHTDKKDGKGLDRGQTGTDKGGGRLDK